MCLSSISMFLLLLTSYTRSSRAIQSNAAILTLTKENFTRTIEENELVFISFCIPWCGHCTVLASEFEKAAVAVNQHYPVLRFAKVDVSANEELAEEQNVHAYPTLRLFRNKLPVAYDGGPRAEDITAWLLKQQRPAVRHLVTIKKLQRFLEKNPIVVVGIFKDLQTEKAKAFYALAPKMEDCSFGVISDDKIIKKLNQGTDSVLLFKQFDGQRILYGGPNEPSALKRFIELNSLPPIIEFEHKTASKILRGPTKAALLFFISKEDDQLRRYVVPLRDLAMSHREHVLFVTITYDDEDKKRVYEHFGIAKNETPSMRLIEFDGNDEIVKYKPNSKEITLKTADDFVQQYIEGSLTRYYKSQVLPDNWNKKALITLVGSNFWNFILDHERTILVAVLAEWCGHCKILEPLIEDLAQRFQDNDEFFVAKIDGALNEVENFKVAAFPTIKLFLRDNKIIDYNGVRTLEGLLAFLEKYGVFYIDKDEL